MDCRNCGRSLADTARFCSFCGAQQRADAPAQFARASPPAHAPPQDPAAVESSDVTVILPRGRANALVAEAMERARATAPPANAPRTVFERPTAPRFRLSTIAVGAAAFVVIVAVAIAAKLYWHGSGVPPEKAAAAPRSPKPPLALSPSLEATIVTPIGTTPSPTPDAASGELPAAATDANTTRTNAPNADATEATNGARAPVTEAPTAPAATTPSIAVPSPHPVPPSKEAQRKKGRAPATAVAEPAPVAGPPPDQPVAPAPPPAPVIATPSVEAARVEAVACANSSNFFSREACLWQECAKPEFRSHAECARFTGPGSQR